ncbi:phosphatase PAP2 family protein [Candidatus Nanohaloarchaea archaeon]|nr:phosphatase PAP2 family protein [Candidatus Nanohaloarchaea archaeon]
MAEHLVSTTTSSFPSGHSAVAWTLAVILSGRKPGLRPYLYTMATLICFSRLYLGVHFLFDVIAGALIGAAVGKIVLRNPVEEII